MDYSKIEKRGDYVVFKVNDSIKSVKQNETVRMLKDIHANTPNLLVGWNMTFPAACDEFPIADISIMYIWVRPQNNMPRGGVPLV